MKKTKLLTSLAALALVVGLGACEVNVEVGDVDVGVDVNPNDSSEDTTTGDTCNHVWGEWTVTTEATCEAEGEQTRTCSLCGETETESIDALGHNWEEVSNTATCIEAGILTEKCSRCETTQTTDVDALGHDPQGAYSLDDEYPESYHTQVCTRCGQDIQEAHVLGNTWSPAGDYYHAQTCEICGLSVQSAHNFGDTYVDSGDGTYDYIVCEDCGFQEQHPHVWGEYQSDGTNHWKECTKCGAVGSQGVCEFTDYGYDEENHWAACSVCGALNGDPVAHDYTESTSTQRGHALACACGYTTAFEEHNYVDIDSPYALEDGHTHAIKECADCGYILGETHQLATESDTTCSVCGAEGLYGGGITYTYSETLGGYVVAQKGFSDTTKTELYIPNTYSGSPVVGTADGTKYAEGAFYNVVSTLTFIGLPNSFVHIGNYAFGVSSGVGTITSLYIPASVEYIGTYSFRYQVIDELVFEPDSNLTEIGTYAFQGNTFTEIELPGSVQTLGSHAFRQCTNLEFVTLTEGIPTIGDSLFYGDTALKEVVIPASVTSIGASAFYNCTALTTIYYGGDATGWSAIEQGYGAFVDSSFNDLSFTVLYYSEEETEGGWHYVAGVPAAW